jgi:uncharacterized protein
MRKRFKAKTAVTSSWLLRRFILHDCVEVPKQSPARSKASKLAAAKARAVLDELGWLAHRIDTVAGAIESHSFSAGIEPQSIEGAVLQDADRLDAIGMVGIARYFYTAGRMGSKLYDTSDPSAANRSPDDRRFALDHFPAKLLKLSSGFHTAAGRRLAQKRHSFLERFYSVMLEEVAGASSVSLNAAVSSRKYGRRPNLG